jgi:hypothetical protein
MSRAIALRQDSDDDGEWSNSASVPSLPVSRRRSLPRSSKRLRDKGESFNENGPRKKNATGSAADLKGLYATEKDVGSEDAQVSDHRESHEGVTTAAAASQPMNSDSSQTSQSDGSANKYSQKLSTSHPPPNAAGRYSTWGDRLSELADYRKIHGHCNVPTSKKKNIKLGEWVTKQRSTYWLHLAGKTSPMTTFRIKELESLDFEWDRSHGGAWEDRLSELADYRKIHGHCNVPRKYSENTQLGNWVKKQRSNYSLHQAGKTSHMTLSRIQELESLGFEWTVCVIAWEDRLSELTDYRKIHGHCNVPQNCSENTKLGKWVGTQRNNYRLHREGKKSQMTTIRIQELESLGFEWRVSVTAWEDRLSELADYRKIHGHCNVPQNYSENSKLAKWVSKQRTNYRLHIEGKTSPMTPFRLQALESLGFEWHIIGAAAAWEDRLSELADYRKIHGHCNVPRNYSENTKLASWVKRQKYQHQLHLKGKTSYMTLSHIKELESVGFEWAICVSAWDNRLSELAAYRKIHGHCNVCRGNSDNTKLGEWVRTQRIAYRLHVEGKASPMTTFRIQQLESLSFEWTSRVQVTPKKPKLDDYARRARERAVEVEEHVQTSAENQEDVSARGIRSNQIEIALEPEESDRNGEVHLAYISGRTEEI